MAEHYELSEEEAKLVDNYRAGLVTPKEEEPKESNNKKEEKDMKVSTKKGLKIAGFTALGTVVLGGVGLLIKKVFFDDPSGLDEFDKDEEDAFDEEDDLFDEDDLDSPAEGDSES